MGFYKIESTIIKKMDFERYQGCEKFIKIVLYLTTGANYRDLGVYL